MTTQQIRGVDIHRFIKRIGRMGDDYLLEVAAALAIVVAWGEELLQSATT